MHRLVIYGAGGFGREVASMALRSGVTDLAFVSDTPGEAMFGCEVIRTIDLCETDELVIAISDGDTRLRLARRCHGKKFTRLIANTAIIGHDVEIGEGAIFSDHSMVTASARIGKHFHCNIYSYVAHDCVIGDYVTFAPKVCCNGNVHIGDGAYIGTGATIRQGTPEKPLTIGAGAIVGMGAVITKDVPPGAVVMGNPARPRGIEPIHQQYSM